MLFKNVILDGIKSGAITLAFRKWKKPSAKEGSLIKTAVGIVKINDVRVVEEGEITEKEAQSAGYFNLQELLKELNKFPAGQAYKISVQFHGPDPRIKLRQKASLTDEELEEIKKKLQRLDQYSKDGTWTQDVLLAIRDNPKMKAADLAVLTGKEKDWLKINVRKLKNLGLTISHNPGYEISPLGEIYVSWVMGNSYKL